MNWLTSIIIFDKTLSLRMVCVPCIVIPVLLYIWHRFLQPIFLKFWNPWAKVRAHLLTWTSSLRTLFRLRLTRK